MKFTEINFQTFNCAIDYLNRDFLKSKKQDTLIYDCFFIPIQEAMNVLDFADYLGLEELAEMCIQKIAFNSVKILSFGDMQARHITSILRRLSIPEMFKLGFEIMDNRSELDLDGIWIDKFNSIASTKTLKNVFLSIENSKNLRGVQSIADVTMHAKRSCLYFYISNTLSVNLNSNAFTDYSNVLSDYGSLLSDVTFHCPLKFEKILWSSIFNNLNRLKSLTLICRGPSANLSDVLLEYFLSPTPNAKVEVVFFGRFVNQPQEFSVLNNFFQNTIVTRGRTHVSTADVKSSTYNFAGDNFAFGKVPLQETIIIPKNCYFQVSVVPTREYIIKFQDLYRVVQLAPNDLSFTLCTLDLSCIVLGLHGAKQIAALFSNVNCCIRNLLVSDTQITASGIIEILDAMLLVEDGQVSRRSHSLQIIKLDFSRCIEYYDKNAGECYKTMGQILSNDSFVSLETLLICGNYSSSIGLAALFEGLAGSKSIQHLGLSGTLNAAPYINNFVPILNNRNHPLRILEIATLGLLPRNLLRFLRAMKKTPLKYLDLSGNTFDSPTISALVSWLSYSSRIESLVLSGNGVAGNWVPQLLDGLQNCKSLTSLVLRNLGLDDSICPVLAGLWSDLEFQHITYLDLSENNITSSGLRYLMQKQHLTPRNCITVDLRANLVKERQNVGERYTGFMFRV